MGQDVTGGKVKKQSGKMGKDAAATVGEQWRELGVCCGR